MVMSLAVLVKVRKSYAYTYKLSMSQGLLLRENKFIGFAMHLKYSSSIRYQLHFDFVTSLLILSG